MTNFKDIEYYGLPSLKSVAKDIQILNLQSRRELNSNSAITLEAGKQVGQKSTDGEKINSDNNMSFSALSENTLPEIGVQLNFGYMNIGSNYFTPGNRYLTNSFQKLNILSIKSLLNNRLSVKLNLDKSWNLTMLRNSESLGLNYKFNSPTSIGYQLSESKIKRISEDSQQRFISHQMTFNTNFSKSISLGSMGHYGLVKKNNLTISKDYLLSVFIKIKINQVNLISKLSVFKKIISIGGLNGYNCSLTMNSVIRKKVNLNCMMGYNTTGRVQSSTFSVGIDFRLGKSISWNTSAGLQNYFTSSIVDPYDYTTQAESSFVVHF